MRMGKLGDKVQMIEEQRPARYAHSIKETSKSMAAAGASKLGAVSTAAPVFDPPVLLDPGLDDV